MLGDGIATGGWLDGRTLVVAAMVAAVLQALSMGYVWYAQFRQREVAALAIGSALMAVGAALAIARPYLPPLVTHVVSVTVVMVGQILIVYAINLFVGRRLPLLLVPAIPAATGLLVAVYTFAIPMLEARIAVYSGFTAIVSLIAARALFSVPPGPLRATHWPLGIVLTVHAVMSVGRAIWALTGGAQEQPFDPSALQTVWFLQAVVGINLTYVGLVLIITQRPRLELDRQATFDSLTAALNRRAFDRLAEVEWSRTTRHELPLSVLVLDLDGFKSLNDAHGHTLGDTWLKAFSDLCRGVLRREDLLCRSGGEEFIALLPQTSLEAALQAAERIRRAVEGLRVAHNGVDVKTTVSIGAATRDETLLDLGAMVAAADRNLYRAKAAGRNRVMADQDL